ncbi:MAG: hypothetical protein ACYTGG_03445 [Planctomycetota bacterium]|jgi:hypothetical protein
MLSFAAAITLTLAPMGAGPVGEQDVFRHAVHAPADVSVYVHLADASVVLGELADRPLARAGHRAAERGQIRAAWRRLVRITGLDGKELLDHVVGDDLTLLARSRGQVREWAVITELGPTRAADLLELLRARVLRTHTGMSVYEATGERLLLAKREGTVILASADRPGLFEDVLPRFGQSEGESLLDTAAAQTARAQLDQGHVGLLLRHDPPLGGWSAAVLRLQGDEIAVQLKAEFENTPFARPRTRIEWDASPLAIFEQNALVTFGEPTDIGDSRLDSVIEAAVGHKLIDDRLGSHLGPRRFLVLGEQELRLTEERQDLLAPTFALCVEVIDKRAARVELERSMVRFVGHLNAFGRHLFNLEPPDEVGPGPRRVDLAPAVDAFFVDTQLLGEVSLNWKVQDSPQGAFCVITSHPQQMDEIVLALRQAAPSTEPRCRKLESVGTFNGVRMARLMQSWADQAGSLAEAGREVELRQALNLLAALSGGVEQCCWQLERPTEKGVEMNLLVRLSPPESSRPN